MINTKHVVFWGAIIFVTVLNYGCSMHVRRVPPNAAFIRQIGLPVYPHAQPVNGQQVTASMKLGGADQLRVTLVTRDDLIRVQDFYAKHVPKNATKTAVSLGFMTGTVYQWDTRDTQKEIMIARIKEMTVIQLQSMALRIPTSTESATPSAQP